MQQLVAFIFRSRVFLLFITFVILCSWLVVNQNSYQGHVYTNTSNLLSGSVYDAREGVTDYLDLKDQNQQLLAENKVLRKQNLMFSKMADSLPQFDSTRMFEVVAAEVINNSYLFQKNFITINRGQADGIKRGMSVLGPNGLVGQVKDCSDNYCTIYSLLHTNQKVSAKDKANGAIGTVKWNGKDPGNVLFVDVPRYINILRGDTIVTSSYNAVHPKDVVIGVVDGVKKEGSDLNQRASVRLLTDFAALHYVYVVGAGNKLEKDSLEQDLNRGDRIIGGEVF